MPVTALDPITALLVVDLQKGIVDYPLIHPADEIVARANTLARAFRDKGLPVVQIVVDGVAPGRTEQARRQTQHAADWTDPIPTLDVASTDIRITKSNPGAFARTELEQRLRALGVTQVVILGIATGGGVDSTARQAYELGFNVTLATDAMTDASAENHEHSINKVFPRLGERGTTAEIVALVESLG